MRSAAVWSTLLWFAFVCEQIRPDLFPPGTLVIPGATGCLFQTRNARGVLLAGLALVLHWIISAHGPPFEVATVLLLSSRLITTANSRGRFDRDHSRRLQPVAVTVAGVLVLSAVLTFGSFAQSFLPALLPRLMVAVPCAVVIAFLSHLFEEFGFRGTTTV